MLVVFSQGFPQSLLTRQDDSPGKLFQLVSRYGARAERGRPLLEQVHEDTGTRNFVPAQSPPLDLGRKGFKNFPVYRFSLPVYRCAGSLRLGTEEIGSRNFAEFAPKPP
jgi:hypothetical protein